MLVVVDVFVAGVVVVGEAVASGGGVAVPAVAELVSGRAVTGASVVDVVGSVGVGVGVTGVVVGSFGSAVPSTVVGVGVGVGDVAVTVAAALVAVGVGVTVPAGARVDGVGVGVGVGVAVGVGVGVAVTSGWVAGAGVAGSFDSQSTVIGTPLMLAVLDAATTVVVGVGVDVVAVEPKSVYSGNENPGGWSSSTSNFIGEMFLYFASLEGGTNICVGMRCCRATKLR